MTSIKRYLRETSYKILGKVGASCGSGSHSLQHNSDQIISTSVDSNNNHLIKRSKKSIVGQQQQSSLNVGAKRSRKSKSSNKNKNKLINSSSSSSAIPEALLIASKNYLPPVQFHHVHGPNVQLHKNKFVARRTQSFCQALVFSNRVILPNERVYIKVLEIAKGWSGTIRFGFTSVDPATLRYHMPKHACPDMTNAGHTWARALADEVIKRNSVIHFSYNTNGFIHYGINNQDCGIFHANVNTNQNLWFIVDIYGLTAAVELIDPRIHNNHHSTSDLDISLDGSDDNYIRGSTMFKSTPAMDELLSQHLALRAQQKRRLKKGNRQIVASAAAANHQASLFYGHSRANRNGHLPEGVILPPGSIRFAAAAAAHHQHNQGPMLPNLSSLVLPAAQQNIYSPMPMINNRPEQQQHDYYQIMTNAIHQQTTPANGTRNLMADHHSSLNSTQSAATVAADTSMHSNYHPTSALVNNNNSNNSTSINNTPGEANNNTGRRGARRSRTASATGDEQAEICQQLSSLQIQQQQQSDNNAPPTTTNNKQQYSSSSSTSTALKSSANNNNNKLTSSNGHHPVAAARRRLKSSIEPNNDSSINAPPINGASSSGSKSSINKSRQSVKSAAAAASKENNNSQQSKDCPICFERPINCVLYQCGHMCTCYECGVKQWRTQQRTCPICRTIIKDVIKTYMS